MAKEEQPDMDKQEEEEEESTLIVRKSRNGNEIKTTETAVVDDGEVSTNGVSDSNGHSQNETESAVLPTKPANEQKIENPRDGELENEAGALNGEQKRENLVFFDKVEGIRKCRICTWKYRNGSVRIDHIQNHKGLLHKLMTIKTSNFESEGVDPTPINFGENEVLKTPEPEKLEISSSPHFAIQNNFSAAVEDKQTANFQTDTFFSFNRKPFHISSLEDDANRNKSCGEIESGEDEVEEDDDDPEVAQVDVERVIKKQNTHGLYCPNCNSCIMRRVILRKRKRRLRTSDEEVKCNKTENVVQSQLHLSDTVDCIDSQTRAVDEVEREGGPEAFRCLSCFSFFIPIGNGFKFIIFGDKGGNFVKDASHGVGPSNLGGETGQPSSSQNATCASEKTVGSAGNNESLAESGDKIFTFFRAEAFVNGTLRYGAGGKLDTTMTETVDGKSRQLDLDMKDHLKDSQSSKEVYISHENDVSVTKLSTMSQFTNGESSDSFSKQDGLKFLISSNNGSIALKNSEGGQITNQPPQSVKDAIHLSTPVSELKASDVDGKLNISVSVPHAEQQEVQATVLTESFLKNKDGILSSLDHAEVYPTELTKFDVHSGKPLKVENALLKGVPYAEGKDAIITIESQPAELSQTAQDIISFPETASLLPSSTQTSIASRVRTEDREEHKIEVIESIVYGGLAELITSLSVVSSAAGGGAGTLNILALAMANLIGGLFVICQNLWELKCESPTEPDGTQILNQVATNTRDKELLGRRQNFLVHAIVSVISYLIFGLVAPVVYCFSYRKTDERQLKLVVVAAASLVCSLAGCWAGLCPAAPKTLFEIC